MGFPNYTFLPPALSKESAPGVTEQVASDARGFAAVARIRTIARAKVSAAAGANFFGANIPVTNSGRVVMTTTGQGATANTVGALAYVNAVTTTGYVEYQRGDSTGVTTVSFDLVEYF